MKIKMIFILSCSIFSSFFVDAQHYRPRKQITPREARVLNQQKRQLHREHQIAKADGVITPAERRILAQDRHRLKRKAYRMRVN